MGVRLVCAFILNLLVIPESKCALDMMHYLTRLAPKSDGEASLSFANRSICFSIACQKFMASIFCAFINLLVIAQAEDIEDII